MARPLRIEYAGACYHVMNRGNQRGTVFRRPEEYDLFLDKLAAFADQFRVRLFCYCCLPNHFHLYLKTEQANLSRFMQGFLTSFTVSLNRSRGSCGHVFQGRFKAHLVEDGAYHAVLSRYIHLNPVRVRRHGRRPLRERRDHLRRFRWSSYPAHIGVRKAPEWLDMGRVLSEWSGTRREQMRRYRRYVEEGLLREVENPFLAAAEQSIVGTDSFVDHIKREYLLRRQSDRREEPSLVHLQASFSLEEVTAAVAVLYGVVPDRLLQRKGAHRKARRMLMYCASKYCRYRSSLTGLASELGVSVSGLTQARDRVAKRLRRDRPLQEELQKVEAKLRLQET